MNKDVCVLVMEDITLKLQHPLPAPNLCSPPLSQNSWFTQIRTLGANNIPSQSGGCRHPGCDHVRENMLVFFKFLFIPLLPQPYPAAPITMETLPGTEMGTFHQQILETVSETLDKSLKSAIATFSARQDSFQEKSSSRLSFLASQISNLLLSHLTP